MVMGGGTLGGCRLIGGGILTYMGVSENRGTPKSSILIGIFIINHPFWGTTTFGNTHIRSIIRLICKKKNPSPQK